MREEITPHDLKTIGENCSSYKSGDFSSSLSRGIYDDEGVSCRTCKSWTGKKCTMDAYDKVALNLGIIPEE
ncbi:MAG: hypothetical protein GX045_12010 [Clostridiaceae bacterium]|jgi:hypothetical protein|nr:hypothetical protein [Clostridiaceae bacterium]